MNLETELLRLLTADFQRTADLAAHLPGVPGWEIRQALDRLAAEGRVVRRRGGKLWRLAPPTNNRAESARTEQESNR